MAGDTNVVWNPRAYTTDVMKSWVHFYRDNERVRAAYLAPRNAITPALWTVAALMQIDDADERWANKLYRDPFLPAESDVQAADRADFGLFTLYG